jgi:hypothetical protein
MSFDGRVGPDKNRRADGRWQQKAKGLDVEVKWLCPESHLVLEYIFRKVANRQIGLFAVS